MCLMITIVACEITQLMVRVVCLDLAGLRIVTCNYKSPVKITFILLTLSVFAHMTYAISVIISHLLTADSTAP